MIENIVDAIFSLGLFINAALFIPQLIKLYKTKTAQGVSIITFAGFSAIQFFTILHGFYHKDYLLIFGFGLSLIMCGSVTVMAIYYGRKKM